METIKRRWIFWYALATGWLFILYEYAVRVSDSVILPALQHEFGLSAADIGALSSGYYFAYIISMIPAGVIIDRYGLYLSWLVAILLVVLGCFLFGYSDSISMLVVARVLMGMGSAFAMIGVFSVALNSQHSGLLIGITMGVCMIGALLGQGPWLQLTQLCGDWQMPYFLSGFFGVILTFFWMFWGKKVSNVQLPSISFNAIKRSFLILLKSPVFWMLALVIGILSTPQTVFMALWGPQFLRSMYALSSGKAAYLNSMMTIGGGVGAVVLGYLGDRYSIKSTLLWVLGVAAICMAMVLQGWVSNIPLLLGLLFLLGFVTNANVIVFAYLGKRFSALPRTTVQGTTNMFNMGGGPVYQVLIGWLITVETGTLTQQLNAGAMQGPLWLIPVSLLVMFGVLVFTTIPSIKGE